MRRVKDVNPALIDPSLCPRDDVVMEDEVVELKPLPYKSTHAKDGRRRADHRDRSKKAAALPRIIASAKIIAKIAQQRELKRARSAGEELIKQLWRTLTFGAQFTKVRAINERAATVLDQIPNLSKLNEESQKTVCDLMVKHITNLRGGVEPGFAYDLLDEIACSSQPQYIPRADLQPTLQTSKSRPATSFNRKKDMLLHDTQYDGRATRRSARLRNIADAGAGASKPATTMPVGGKGDFNTQLDSMSNGLQGLVIGTITTSNSQSQELNTASNIVGYGAKILETQKTPLDAAFQQMWVGDEANWKERAMNRYLRHAERLVLQLKEGLFDEIEGVEEAVSEVLAEINPDLDDELKIELAEKTWEMIEGY